MTTRRKSRYFSSPKHAWSNKNRFLLSLLDLLFANHPSDFASIFNHLNEKTLRREGFKNGIPASSIVAQLHKFRRGGTGSRIYLRVSAFSHTELRDLFTAEIRVIQDAAREAKVNLIPRLMLDTDIPQPPPISSFRRRMREATIPTETSITTWQPQSDEDDDDEAEHDNFNTPSKLSRTQRPDISPQNKYLSPMISPTSTDLNAQRRPFFLYRAFEVAHGLTARRFIGKESDIPLPPRSKSRQFGDEVRPHLDRNKRYASPFLSFCESPAIALKHMFTRVTADGVPMALAVVRYDDLKRDSLTRFGADCGPYLVPVICKFHEMFDLPGAYTGTGEFLVWGSARCEPIAIVNAVDALMIRAIMRTTSGMDLEGGRRLSRFIPKLSDEKHTELLIYQLVKGYKVKGHQLARKSTGYDEFVRGAMSTLSSSATTTMTTPLTTQVQSPEVIMIDSDEDEDQNETSFDTNVFMRATSPDIDIISDTEPDGDTESQPEVDSDDDDIIVLPRRRRVYAADWRSDTA